MIIHADVDLILLPRGGAASIVEALKMADRAARLRQDAQAQQRQQLLTTPGCIHTVSGGKMCGEPVKAQGHGWLCWTHYREVRGERPELEAAS